MTLSNWAPFPLMEGGRGLGFIVTHPLPLDPRVLGGSLKGEGSRCDSY